MSIEKVLPENYIEVDCSWATDPSTLEPWDSKFLFALSIDQLKSFKIKNLPCDECLINQVCTHMCGKALKLIESNL